MPELSKDLVSLLSYLLPGFLVAWIFYSLTTHQKPAQLERVIQALIFTLLVSGLVIVVREGLYLAGRAYHVGNWDKDSELLVSIVLALALGLCVAYLTNTDTLHEWLRKKKISKRSSHRVGHPFGHPTSRKATFTSPIHPGFTENSRFRCPTMMASWFKSPRLRT